jgi:hypothetical protein
MVAVSPADSVMAIFVAFTTKLSAVETALMTMVIPDAERYMFVSLVYVSEAASAGNETAKKKAADNKHTQFRVPFSPPLTVSLPSRVTFTILSKPIGIWPAVSGSPTKHPQLPLYS